MPTSHVVQGVVSFQSGESPGWQKILIRRWRFRGSDDHEYQGISGGFWPLAGLRFGVLAGLDEGHFRDQVANGRKSEAANELRVNSW